MQSYITRSKTNYVFLFVHRMMNIFLTFATGKCSVHSDSSSIILIVIRCLKISNSFFLVMIRNCEVKCNVLSMRIFVILFQWLMFLCNLDFIYRWFVWNMDFNYRFFIHSLNLIICVLYEAWVLIIVVLY